MRQRLDNPRVRAGEDFIGLVLLRDRFARAHGDGGLAWAQAMARLLVKRKMSMPRKTGTGCSPEHDQTPLELVLLTAGETADLLRTTRSAIYAMVERGQFRCDLDWSPRAFSSRRPDGMACRSAREVLAAGTPDLVHVGALHSISSRWSSSLRRWTSCSLNALGACSDQMAIDPVTRSVICCPPFFIEGRWVCQSSPCFNRRV